MNANILNPEVQKFLREHGNADVSKIALLKSRFRDVSSRELAEQLDSRQRSAKKLPLWHNTPRIYFPPRLSMEQSSSEVTAEHKSKLIKGDKIIDLTGGFGVDSFYFSKRAKEVLHCERNEELSAIAKHNLNTLGAKNVRFIGSDSIEFLKSTSESFDTIYIDPSRRVQTKKVFLLRDTEPDVVGNLPLMLEKASRVVIKTSPLLDIQSGLKELRQVSEVHVISLKNDCKELIWIIDRGFEGEPRITASALSAGQSQTYNFSLSNEHELKLESWSAPLAYIYEPDVALLKAGAFKSIAAHWKISKLQQNTHLYTSENKISDFIGKVFTVQSASDYKTFIKEKPLSKANIISRNFPHSPEELKKRHNLTDGGEDYLIFTTAYPERLLVIHASL